MDSISFSNSISKETRFENTEMSTAYFEDLKNRKNDAITNERIQKDDIILDTYEVTSDAISGGMGSVWRVHHNSWNTDLAMKRPQPRFFAEGGDQKKAQFVSECENWINLGLHPNIVSCYYVREIGGVPTIFSEWMDGGSLSDRIKDGSLYEGTEAEIQERILDIAIQAARGLQYSHENGLIHQDFKPSNLLLTKEWDAKVADFGLAKAKSNLDEDSETAKTTGYTLAYCPQEQVDREEPQKWMDVYSWALTVLEMYAGKRLWNTGAEAKEHFEEYPAQCKFKLPDKMPDLLKDCLNIRKDEKPVFDIAVKALLLIYHEVTRVDYPRKAAKSSVVLTADNINNYALSMIDLGKPEQAESLWAKALELAPTHRESLANLTMLRWRNRTLTDEEAYNQLNKIDDCYDYLLDFLLEKDSFEKVSMLHSYIDPIAADFDGEGNVWTAHQHYYLYRYKSGTNILDQNFTDYDFSAIAAFREADKLFVDGTSNVKTENPFAVILLSVWDDSRWHATKCILKYDPYERRRYQINSLENCKKLDPIKEISIHAMWLEDDDRVLCVAEKVKWEKAISGEEHTDIVVERYRLSDAEHGKLLPYEPRQNAVERLCEKWGFRGNPVDAVFDRDKIRGCIGGYLAVSRYQPLALVEYKLLSISATFVCRPRTRDARRLYWLCRFSNVETATEREFKSQRMEREFSFAVKKQDYQKAIGIFEQYRELPEKADAEKTVEMEKTLAKVCTKTGVHHLCMCSCPSFVPDRPLYYDTDYLNYRLPVDSDHSVSVLQAIDIAREKLPIKFKWIEDGREEMYEWGKDLPKSDPFWVVAVRVDCRIVYLRIRTEGIIRVDIETGKVTPVLLIGQENTPEQECMCSVTPDGKIWTVSTKHRDTFVTGEEYVYTQLYYHSFHATENVSKETNPYSHFSPDSRFYIAANGWLKPLEKKRNEALKEDQIGYLPPPLIHMLASGKEAAFSRDGMILATEESGYTQGYRISYYYSFEGFRDWDGAAESFAQIFLYEHPDWTERDFDGFMDELSNRGLGFLRRESVYNKLKEMHKLYRDNDTDNAKVVPAKERYKKPGMVLNSKKEKKKKGFFSKLFGKK